MIKFHKGMIYTTELKNLRRLSFFDLKAMNMIFEKQLFEKEINEKIILLLECIDENLFKEITTETYIRVEPQHDTNTSDPIITGTQFDDVYMEYINNVLYVKSSDLKEMTEKDKMEASKIGTLQLKQLLFKINRIASQQFLDEIKNARILEDEIILLSSGADLFDKHKNKIK